MLTYWEILTAIQSNVPVNDSYAQLWGKKSQNNYTIVTYTGTLPATLTGTKAGYLHRYKVYGNSSGGQECGERTENLFDGVLLAGYYYTIDRINSEGTSGLAYRSFRIQGLPAGTYTVAFGIPVYLGRLWRDNEMYRDVAMNVTSYTLSTSDGDIAFSFRDARQGVYWDDSTYVVLVSGSTAPESYIPYGYKLPLTSGSTPVDIYIGDDTLSTDEYIDSGTDKVYRMVGGVLTTTDPPVPFPQIPTSAGSTTIGWAGEGLAPSQVELEYEKKR